MCDPVTLGVTAAVGAGAQAVGGLKSAADQKTAEVNNYKRKLQIRRMKWDGQRAMYGTKLAEFDTTIQENALSASRAYADEQTRLNNLFKQADSAALDAFTRVMENMRYVGSGKTAQRRQARDLAKYGRDQAMVASNLIRAHESYQSRVEGIREKLRTTNRGAYSKVQFKPQPGVPPVKPNVDMTAANLQFIGGMASAVSSGFSTYNSLKAPDVGNMGGFGDNIDFKTGGTNYFSQPFDYNLNMQAPTGFLQGSSPLTSGMNFDFSAGNYGLFNP